MIQLHCTWPCCLKSTNQWTELSLNLKLVGDSHIFKRIHHGYTIFGWLSMYNNLFLYPIVRLCKTYKLELVFKILTKLNNADNTIIISALKTIGQRKLRINIISKYGNKRVIYSDCQFFPVAKCWHIMFCNERFHFFSSLLDIIDFLFSFFFPQHKPYIYTYT